MAVFTLRSAIIGFETLICRKGVYPVMYNKCSRISNTLVKIFRRHNMTVLFPNPCFKEVCFKGTALYLRTEREIIFGH